MHKYLNGSQKEQIKKAIEKIESHSSSEVVVAATNSLNNSKFVLFIYSLIFTSICAVILDSFVFENSYKTVVEFSVVIFLFLYFSLLYNPFTYKIIPKSIKRRRCDDFALYQFQKLGVDKTSNHKAILIFICLREKFIRIVADKQIDDTVSNDTWQKIISDFISRAKEDKIADGILTIVESCGNILIKEFPKDKNSKDELSNEVIEI